jgi:hypothetical protein
VEVVKLTPEETYRACQVGLKRHIKSMAQHHRPKVKQTCFDFAPNLLGALGEFAFSKATGIPWDASEGTFKTIPDVGPFEIRTRSSHGWELYIRDDDPGDRIYFLLTTENLFEYRLHGSMLCSDVKSHGEWLKDHGNYGRPAFFVPTNKLDTALLSKLVNRA